MGSTSVQMGAGTHAPQRPPPPYGRRATPARARLARGQAPPDVQPGGPTGADYAPAVAARRLILLMLALLVVSSIAASLVPVDPNRLRETTTTERRQRPEPPSGRSVTRTVDADAARPATIRLALGDRLELTVSRSRPGLVEITGTGEIEFADPAAPARFDLLPYREGELRVRFVDPPALVARIEVGERRR